MCFSCGNIFLSYVNERMYLLGNLPFFKIHVNCFMARIVFWPEMIPLVDDSIPFEKILSPLRWFYLKIYIVGEEPGATQSWGISFIWFSWVQLSYSVMSDSVTSGTARLPCLSPSLGVHPNPCPLSQWCHPTISSSVVPFSSCPQSFPASGSFPMSQLFASGGQSIGVPTSTSVLPTNTQDWSPLGWTGWIS